MLAEYITEIVDALGLEISAIRSRGSESVVEVFNGEKTSSVGGESLYRFVIPDESSLREDVPIKLIVSGEKYDGMILSVDETSALISISHNLGRAVNSARVVMDNSFLSDRLRSRLKELSKGEGEFVSKRALQVMGKAPISGGPDLDATLADRGLNEGQERAVRKALGSEVSWIWGPPGTGKTHALSSIGVEFYRRKQRVLIVSNTNLAVDTLVEKICDRLSGSELFEKSYSVVRYGSPVKEELIDKHGAKIDLYRAMHMTGNQIFSRKHQLRVLREKADVAVAKLGRMVRGEEPVTIPEPEASLEAVKDKLKEIERDLRSVEEEQADHRKSILQNSLIVATTAHQVYLKPKDFENFDVVIADEATMLQLGIMFYVSGLARKRLVIAGDFSQLSAIITSDHEQVKKWLGRNVFEAAGIVRMVRGGEQPSYLEQLRTQYRMVRPICSLINRKFYGGKLVTAEGAGKTGLSSSFLKASITVVDTSMRNPQVGMKMGSFSRYNVFHALGIRNLVHHFIREGYVGHDNVTDEIGIVTPYAAQSYLINNSLEGIGLEDAAMASTVHRFQGNEKTAMIIDITDGWGFLPSQFVGATSIDDEGAKLLNVALSRARNKLVIFANLKWLNSKLPEGAVLRDILAMAKENGETISLDRLMRVGPEAGSDWLEYVRVNGKIFDWSKVGIYSRSTIIEQLSSDLGRAREGICVFTSSVSMDGVQMWKSKFSDLLMSGGVVRVVTRPLHAQSSPDAPEAFDQLREMGVSIDMRHDVSERMIYIDGKILWHGNYDLLAEDHRVIDTMVRICDRNVSHVLSGFASISRLKGKSIPEGRAAILMPENDDCADCGAHSILKMVGGRLKFVCSQECGWQSNLKSSSSRVISGSSKSMLDGDIQELLKEETDKTCAECGSPMLLRSGAHGEFWGCSSFPACRNVEKIEKRK